VFIRIVSDLVHDVCEDGLVVGGYAGVVGRLSGQGVAVVGQGLEAGFERGDFGGGSCCGACACTMNVMYKCDSLQAGWMPLKMLPGERTCFASELPIDLLDGRLNALLSCAALDLLYTADDPRCLRPVLHKHFAKLLYYTPKIVDVHLVPGMF